MDSVYEVVSGIPSGVMTRDLYGPGRILYPARPDDPGRLVKACDKLMTRDTWAALWLVTAWV